MVYPIVKIWLNPLCRMVIRKIRGLDNIPKPPFIIAANHDKRIDTFLIIYLIINKLDTKVHFIALPRLWFLGDKICREWAGCIPLFNSKQAYKEAKKLILEGEVAAIYPEGEFNRVGRKKPKTGAVRLAIDTKVPILPIGLKSSYLPFSSKINIGRPIYAKKNIGKQAEELMEKIYGLGNAL